MKSLSVFFIICLMLPLQAFAYEVLAEVPADIGHG